MTALTGRVALVTGGNGGIGLGMAKGMAAAGADIVIWGRNETKNADAVATIEAIGRRAAAFVVDAGDEQQIVETLAASIEAMGHVDVAIANAGTSRGGVAITDVTLDAWRLVHRLNLDGVFLLFREAARHMIDRGEGGSLIAVSSTASIHGPAGNHSYASSKT
ncbi:MAG: SDR family NAD(P)-dependent oxidoreductase, partial [Acidimicrobiia bacterium]|nr:SDR family NAD(P)-dependent oxidoreductase [Acidimicrobiia bacterium]